MTSEICMMNRLAVVLAADSATTVSRWNGGQREERYFKGANKIFQLSDSEPVGLMIFDSADLLRMPWELAIKTFRKQLGKKSFNTVDEYAKEFFAFLNDNQFLYPKEIQDETLIKAVGSQTNRWVIAAAEGVEKENVQASIATKLEAEERALAEVPLFETILAADAAKLFADLIRPLTDQNSLAHFLRPIDMMRQGWLSSFRQASQQ